MANTRIKPQAADTTGLTAVYSNIGVDVKNCAVVATDFIYQYANDTITFDVYYYWNSAAADTWFTDKSINPFKPVLNMSIVGIDPNKSLVNQCLDYLLTLPQFNGSQLNTLIWVKA